MTDTINTILITFITITIVTLTVLVFIATSEESTTKSEILTETNLTKLPERK